MSWGMMRWIGMTLLKGHYIVMENAPIHTAKEIDELKTKRGYKSICFPPYSPELNPNEQFWEIVKNKVKRCRFEDKEGLLQELLKLVILSLPITYMPLFSTL
jgi:transposase